MYCRMNIYNGNELVNPVSTCSASQAAANYPGYQTLYAIVPVQVAVNAGNDDDCDYGCCNNNCGCNNCGCNNCGCNGCGCCR